MGSEDRRNVVKAMESHGSIGPIIPHEPLGINRGPVNTPRTGASTASRISIDTPSGPEQRSSSPPFDATLASHANFSSGVGKRPRTHRSPCSRGSTMTWSAPAMHTPRMCSESHAVGPFAHPWQNLWRRHLKHALVCDSGGRTPADALYAAME
jgi:hypothetical protein